ncbi:hypothetical protein N7492_006079 [Penicillium capsulatum]|uniref:Hydrophobin n=1 Tax=Penicillium capsulatum TaxID=69766 RepID=A0A9W9I2X0_9EURO|nr:hypothetical protein N7492_006079 [Penicillium capsulatum]KAJ6108729.1 hypothetical protein N7512_008566 [Penicillium capsulatum]
MKYTVVLTALASTAIAVPTYNGDGKTSDKSCSNEATIVCSGNGNGGLLSLGNIAPGLLGDYCSGGDVYCCSSNDVQNGLINLNLDLQCSLNHLL